MKFGNAGRLFMKHKLDELQQKLEQEKLARTLENLVPGEDVDFMHMTLYDRIKSQKARQDGTKHELG